VVVIFWNCCVGYSEIAYTVHWLFWNATNMLRVLWSFYNPAIRHWTCSHSERYFLLGVCCTGIFGVRFFSVTDRTIKTPSQKQVLYVMLMFFRLSDTWNAEQLPPWVSHMFPSYVSFPWNPSPNEIYTSTSRTAYSWCL